MNPDELRTFLDRTAPALLGVVATLRRDGSPHAVPVWYRFDGEAIRIWTGEDRAWVANVRRDPRVSFAVQEGQFPFAAAVFHGTAAVVTGDTPEVHAEIRAITERYVEPGDVEEYVASWQHIHTIVTICPASVASWATTEYDA
jgi:PPOX class probable F420-dependent enzyme